MGLALAYLFVFWLLGKAKSISRRRPSSYRGITQYCCIQSHIGFSIEFQTDIVFPNLIIWVNFI